MTVQVRGFALHLACAPPHIVEHRQAGEDEEQDRERHGGDEAEMAEAEGASEAAAVVSA